MATRKLKLYFILILAFIPAVYLLTGFFDQKSSKEANEGEGPEECLVGYVEIGEDYEYTVTGFEKHEIGGKDLEVCCSVIKTANGTAKFCHDLIRSKLNPVGGYMNFVIYKLEGEKAVKSIEGYEKDGEFFWKAYEDGEETTIVYYKSNGRNCARFLSENGTIESDTCA